MAQKRGFDSFSHLRGGEDGRGRVLTGGKVGGDLLLDLGVPTEGAEHLRGHHLRQAHLVLRGCCMWKEEGGRGGGEGEGGRGMRENEGEEGTEGGRRVR